VSDLSREIEGTASISPAAESVAFEAKVLRAFVRDGRLVSIPARDRKRQVVLRWLAQTCFTEDRAYPEKEVNVRLASSIRTSRRCAVTW
jgi:hypothetical protein